MIHNGFVKSKDQSFNLSSFFFIWQAEKQPVALLVSHDQRLVLLCTEQDQTNAAQSESIPSRIVPIKQPLT